MNPKIELLSPAGNREKLKYAYLYGADAAYIGLTDFSLRLRADNFTDSDLADLEKIKGNRKLYCALNIFFLEKDLMRLKENLHALKGMPFDAFIVSDLGIVPLLKKHFPDVNLHLSTQANCVNSSAASVYKELGFSRVILGREVSLSGIKTIKDSNPDLEIEVFAHGAMCIAYSGRCLLSAYMAGRSANSGDCTHSCRWNYRLLEEEKRPGEYFPIEQGKGFTTILSSKDLCMFDYLSDLSEAGVDAIKIEGRMKSLYYTALVTRAYRKGLDALYGADIRDLEQYREDLFRVSHREYGTGFFFDEDRKANTTEGSYLKDYLFIGTLGEPDGSGGFFLNIKNSLRRGEEIEFIGPDVSYIKDASYSLFNGEGAEIEKADHGKVSSLRTRKPVKTGFILRKKIPN